MTKKPNKYENKDSFKDKLKAKKLVEKWEDTYLKRYNSGIPLNRLILLKKNYSHIEQYRDFLICKAARGKRNIIKDKEKAELGDLYIDKQGKLECYLGYKWFTLSDIKNKEFKHLLIEGDRLFKPSFIKECYNVTNNVRVIILKVGEMTLKNRHKQRGDNQSESWLRAKKTTVNNIKETFPCHILNNIDVFDQNICLEYIIGKDIYAQVNPSQTNLFI